MIIPNAKCVVNGPKVNEVIGVINDMLNVVVSEEFEVVEYGNKPGRRWFFTGKLTGQKQDSASPGRDELNNGSGAGSNNRDKLNTGIAGGGGALKDDGGAGGFGGLNVGPDGGGPALGGGAMVARDAGGPALGGGAMVARDAGQAARDFDDTIQVMPVAGGGGGGGGAFGGGTDAFGNELNADGTRVTPGGMLKYTGDAGQAARDFDDTPGTGGGGGGGGAFGGGTDAFGNELNADGTRVTPGGMPSFTVAGDAGQAARDFDDTPAVGGGSPPPKKGAPTTRTPRPSSSMPMLPEGTDLSQSLPYKNGGVDMRTLGNMVAEGLASPYQEQFYNDAGGDAGGAARDSTINDRFIQSEHDLYSENIKRIQQIVTQQGGDINVYLESFNRVFEAGYAERRRRFFDQAFKK